MAFWIYSVVASTNARTLKRYQTLSSPLQIDSLRQRVDEIWPRAWADFRQSPLIGHGPGKAFLPVGLKWGVIDSEYLDVLREQGIVGFIVFLGYYFYPLYLMRKGFMVARVLNNLQRERVRANLVALQASFAMGVLALIMDVGMATFYSPFFQGFLWLWLGIGVRSAENIRKSIQPSDLYFPGLLHPQKFNQLNSLSPVPSIGNPKP